MLTADELDQARDDLAEELPDTVSVQFQDGTTLDPETLVEMPSWVNRHVGVPALVVRDTQTERVVETSGALTVLRAYLVTVPTHHDGAPVTVLNPRSATQRDRIVVTSSHDPETAGATPVVREVRHGSLSISRRLTCQEEG